jgi:type I site-specific restriction endonuclease
MKKTLSIDQQKIISQALRSGYPEELITVLAENGLNYFQMQEIVNAYSGGMELAKVLEIANQKSNAYEMRQAFQRVVAAMEEVKTEVESNSTEIPQEVTDMLKRLEDSLSVSGERQDYLQSIEEQLRSMKQSDDCESEAVKTLKESVEQLERQLENQQERLNEANRHIKEQENEMKSLRKERDEMLRQKQELERTMETFREEHKKEETVAGVSKPTPSKVDEGLQKETDKTTVPVHFQTSIPIKSGAAIPVVIERTEHRQQRGLLAVAEKLLPNKPVKNLVRQLVGKGLSKEQMQAVKVAIESGLSDEEVADIIDSGFSAEEMLSAIEIVVADRNYN